MADQCRLEVITRVRSSKYLVIFVVFIAMMLDLIMLTTLEPILPSILYRMEQQNVGSVTSDNSSDSDVIVLPTADPHDKRGIMDITRKVGIVIATKPTVEIFANILVGFIVERYGHKYPMLFGCLGNFVSCVIFAFGGSFYVYVIARIIQAFGSSLSVVSGLALIATTFTDDKERTRATSIAFGGLAFGVVVGFPFGSVTYQFMGRLTPFLILACLSVLDGGARMCVRIPQQEYIQEKKSNSDWLKLLADPYIMIVLGCNFVEHLGLGMIIATEPAWMQSTFHCEQWQIGTVLVIGALTQFAGQYACVPLAVHTGRWLFCVLGLALTGIGYLLYPACENVWQVLGPEMLSRIGLGFILSMLSPLLGFIVDTRHGSKYGAVFGLYASSYNLGFVFGPLLGGVLLHVFTFPWMYRGCACILFLYSIVCFLLRKVELQGNASEPDQKGVKYDDKFRHESLLYSSTTSRGSMDRSSLYPPLLGSRRTTRTASVSSRYSASAACQRA